MSEKEFQLGRRELLAYAAVLGPTVVGASIAAGQQTASAAGPSTPGKKYRMKKSINLWALPYPGRFDLEQCLTTVKQAGFDGVELNYDLESDISVKASEKELRRIGTRVRDLGLEISGLCSFLFWPIPLKLASSLI